MVFQLKRKIIITLGVIVTALLGVYPVVAQEETEEYVYDPQEVYEAMDLMDNVMPSEELVEQERERMLVMPEEEEAWYEEISLDEWGLVVAAVITSVLWIILLIDALKRPLTSYPGTGTGRKWLWVVGILLTHIISSLLYFFVVYREKEK